MNLEGNGHRLLLTEYTPCRTWQGVYSRPQGMSIPAYTHRHTHEEEKVLFNLINLINLISASYAFHAFQLVKHSSIVLFQFRTSSFVFSFWT